MRWCCVEGTHISFVEVGVPIPDDVWDQCMDTRRDPQVVRCLSIVSGDGFPQITHRQWRYSASVMIERKFPVAIISSHRSTLAIVRSANWNGATVRALRWAEFDDAVEFIGVPPQQRAHVRMLAERLRHGLPIIGPG